MNEELKDQVISLQKMQIHHKHIEEEKEPNQD